MKFDLPNDPPSAGFQEYQACSVASAAVVQGLSALPPGSASVYGSAVGAPQVGIAIDGLAAVVQSGDAAANIVESVFEGTCNLSSSVVEAMVEKEIYDATLAVSAGWGSISDQNEQNEETLFIIENDDENGGSCDIFDLEELISDISKDVDVGISEISEDDFQNHSDSEQTDMVGSGDPLDANFEAILSELPAGGDENDGVFENVVSEEDEKNEEMGGSEDYHPSVNQP